MRPKTNPKINLAKCGAAWESSGEMKLQADKLKYYPDWLRDAAVKGGKAKSEAKTAAARKANAARWQEHKKKKNK